MYLLHHEGEGAGPLFIRNELYKLPKGKFASAEERLKHVFVQQVGTVATANYLISQAGNDVFKAYRKWLSKYINDKIILTKFACGAENIPIDIGVQQIFEKVLST